MSWWSSLIDSLGDLIPKELAGAFVAMLGAVSHYCYQIQMGKNVFELSRFLITCVLGLYMGNLVGEFLPDGMQYRDGWLSLSGFAMYQIYYVLDTHLSSWFKRVILGKLMHK